MNAFQEKLNNMANSKTNLPKIQFDASMIKDKTLFEAEKLIFEYLTDIYISKPKEPSLKSTKPSTEEINEYNLLKLEYDALMTSYSKNYNFYYSEKSRLHSILVEKIKEDSGLNDIPEQYREKVYNYAYQRGHSSGMSEVKIYLDELVEIFN